jgi:hypothetical protein
MTLTALSPLEPLEHYDAQARELLAGHRSGEPAAARIFHENHPRFLDPVVRWLPRQIPDSEILGAELGIEDARLAVARGYSFRDWPALVEHVAAVSAEGPVREFELASEAVIDGDLETLEAMLRANPDLVRSRSSRITCNDPPVHRATLLHYLAANGVEGYRQRTPPNAVAMATRLLEAGAEVDALAGMYGGEYPTMSMLVSSDHPARAGVQVPLVHALLDFGAAIEGCGSPQWHAPLLTALIFGMRDAAQALVDRGARLDDLAVVAGLGRVADVQRLLPSATPAQRHAALALAAQLGQAEVVRVLLDAGEDPNRHNPDGFHSHATPLHHAAVAGHDRVVRLLVERGARTDLEDSLWHGTPLGWARYGGQTAVAEYLSAAGSR